MNDRAALDLLLAHGPLSRSRIGRLTGLSKPTASQLLARLEAAGLVVVTGTSAGRPGPNAQLYAVNPEAAHVAGLDVTARGIRAAVADVTGRTVGTYALPTPGRRGSGETGPSTCDLVVRAVEGAVKAAGLHRSRLHRIVVGTPGAFDPNTGRLRYASHLPGWHSPTLLEELAAALPMPLEYDNDVNLVAVAEQRLGAARGDAGDPRDFVLLWNEEGIGAALVIDGRLHRGWTGGAGELGFLPVPGTPLVRDAARTGSGGFQELAGAGAVLRLAGELGLVYDRGVPAHHAAAELLRRAAAVAGTEEEAEGDGAASRTGGPDGATTPAGPEPDAHTADGSGPGSRSASGSGPGRRGTQADAFAVPGPAEAAALLHRFATGTAVGLAALVAVLDPALIVLSGGVLTAGGEPLRARIRAELAELAVPRPRLVPGALTAHPVLSGALESALITTRDEVFDTAR
ncbi:ROK family transcriptional regulator [Streptomyces sp. JJ36]|uniref:ROK family transcriptional regulator n=1 Tax=Streptomyces sp. JJ36 TaxID=2736645 RepID=UPI001F3B3DE5|nr:ROK family transcriptional regulator [Streptomyces sp. JJ36]